MKVIILTLILTLILFLVSGCVTDTQQQVNISNIQNTGNVTVMNYRIHEVTQVINLTPIPEPTSSKYNISFFWMANNSNSDIIIELSYNCSKVKLSCLNYSNSTVPIIITPKNATVFEFSNTTCKLNDRARVEYMLPDNKIKNVSFLLKRDLVSFGLNFTD